MEDLIAKSSRSIKKRWQNNTDLEIRLKDAEFQLTKLTQEQHLLSSNTNRYLN